MSPFSRRRLFQASIAAGAAAVAAASRGRPASAAPAGDESAGTYDLTILGTADLHGHVLNWDYYRDAEYDDSAHNDVGLAKLSSLITEIRAERAGAATLVVDAGDTIQGTPLAYYYALREPASETGAVHPMAGAMNVLGYDAVVLGNHEFNYGLPLLDTWIKQLDCPVLAANALDATTGRPAFRPYLIKRIRLTRSAPVLRVGILGLTNPGSAVWDRATTEGRLTFEDLVTSAARWVPVIKRQGADLVLVIAHSGDSGTSSYGPELPTENASALIAEQVADVDAVLCGHTHIDLPQRLVTNQATGRQVLLSQPSKYGQRLTRMDFTVTRAPGRWVVSAASGATLPTTTVPEDPAVLSAVSDQHTTTIRYVNQVVAVSTTELTTAQSHYLDTPIIDFVNHVQAQTVAAALAGTAHAGLPVLSISAPFSRTAVFPAGEVRIKDVAGLYVYDNTLEAVVLSGAQVRAYLEYSAKYFRTLDPQAPVDPDSLNDPTVPDYNYDILSGVDYLIDVSQPVGSRIVALTHPGSGAAVTDTDRFVVAVNNYRRSGGGSFPGITTTPVYNEQREIRQLLIDWARVRGVIDPADFWTLNWQLVRRGVPVF